MHLRKRLQINVRCDLSASIKSHPLYLNIVYYLVWTKKRWNGWVGTNESMGSKGLSQRLVTFMGPGNWQQPVTCAWSVCCTSRWISVQPYHAVIQRPSVSPSRALSLATSPKAIFRLLDLTNCVYLKVTYNIWWMVVSRFL